MGYGVIIEKGAQDWQIFQHRNNKADITISGRYTLTRTSQELPLIFETVDERSSIVRGRVVLEDTGESIIAWTNAKIQEDQMFSITFRDVPLGGMYRIETCLEYDGCDGLSVTRGDMIHFIGVGDIFVIAGQSNAAGRAMNPVEDGPHLGIHMLKSTGKWTLATHPLNEMTGLPVSDNYENHNPGHSPWLFFAKRIYKDLGYPIGLINSAFGGALLRWWNRKENGLLFENLLQLLKGQRITPKAILWYQGEAEGFENAAASYLKRFTEFVCDVRESLHQPKLPFFTVQLNRCLSESTVSLDHQWGMVREAQRQAAHNLENVYVIPTTDLSMYDFIHNSSEANLIIGNRVARCFLSVSHKKNYDWKAPEAVQAVKTGENSIILTLEPILNWINDFGIPKDQLPINAQDSEGLLFAEEYQLDGHSLKIWFHRDLGQGAVVHGCWRMNPGIAITDCMRLPMLSFYGMKIREEKNAD